MTTLHPTTIKLWQNHCGHAISLWKKHTPYDREIFQTGVAVHYMLEMCGLAHKAACMIEQPEPDYQNIIRNSIETLATKGRAYDGIPEPPIPLHNLWEARDIANKYIAKHPFNDIANYEEEFALTSDGNYTHYNDPKAMLRTIIDVVKVETIYDEDGNYKQVTLTDYKSSWRTPPEMLDNLQRRCQAVCAWIKYNPDVLVLEIANLRTLHHHSRTINCHHEEQLLHTWLKDIMQAAHIAMTDLAPRPGINCIKCPYVLSCDYRYHALNNEHNMAAQYASAIATAKELEPKIKAICKTNAIKTPNGSIGFMATERKSAMKDAHATALDHWIEQGGKPEDLIAMMKPSVAVLEKIAKRLFPDEDERNEFLRKCVLKKNSPRFGIHKG